MVFVHLATMKRVRIYFGKAGILLLLGLVAAHCASAATLQRPSGPYHGIVERNVFDLRAPVVVAQAPVPNPIVLPKITLTGITTIFGRTIAFVTIAGDKPGQPLESVMLVEGQTFHDIEVKKIDCKGGIVQVINHGQSQTLDFDGKRDPGFIIHEYPQPGPHSEAPLSPEEQVALIEIQREKYRQENNPAGQILPPTEMTSESR